MIRIFCIVLFLLLVHLQGKAQNKLRISYERFGKLRTYELYTGDLLDYKLKGQLFYRQDKIANLRDSLIVFSHDTVVRIDRLKKIRIMSSSHLAKTMQDVFAIGGFSFIFLNTVNNAIYNRQPYIEPAAVYISGGLIATAFVIKQLRTKRIHITKRKDLKIIEGNFQNLNGGGTFDPKRD